MECVCLERYRAIYLEIPKVACTSIKTALAPLAGVRLEDGGNPHEAQWPAPPCEARRAGPLFPGWWTFAFVRNPWDRLVSCYRDKIRGEVDGFTFFTIRPGVANCLARFDAFVAGMPFEDFVRAVATIGDDDADEHFRSQSAFVTDAGGRLAVDFIGRYERLAEDFGHAARMIGLPPTELPRLQAARTTASYAAFYSDQTQRLVAHRYARDVEMFGYAFDAH